LKRFVFSGQFKPDNPIISNEKIDAERNSRETPSLKRFYFLIEYRDAVYSLLPGTSGNKRCHRSRSKENDQITWTLAKRIVLQVNLPRYRNKENGFY